MRNTEMARNNFYALGSTSRTISSHERRDKEGTLALGLANLSLGLATLAEAVADIYDKLQEIDRKLSQLKR
jgi:hypothetical protein